MTPVDDLIVLFRFDGFGSESDQPMTPFHHPPLDGPLDLDALATIVGAPLSDRSDDVAGVLDGLLAWQKRVGEHVVEAEALLATLRAMDPLLGAVERETEAVERRAFIVGQQPDGALVGIETMVVWT
jgi:hypothetical protein